MQALVLRGNPPIEIAVRRSAQARRLTLRISSLDGRVTLTLPRGISERQARAFAEEKEPWLRQHLERQEPEVPVALGARLPVDGMSREVVSCSGRRVVLEETRLLVPGAPDRVGARTLGFLKTRARDALAQASDRYAAAVGCRYSGLTLRDTRSRWGSCTSAGRLMYSWRLTLAPPEVLDYVAAHEVAHLVEMNHSRAFWSLVEEIYGDYRPPRDWLRREGASLHRYRFGD